MPVLMMLTAMSMLLADQVSKRIIVTWLAEREVGWRRSILAITRITVARREPRSVRGTFVLLGVWALAVLGAVLYVAVVVPSRGAPAQFGLGCAIGGATGNLLDRLWRGGIVDFIAVGFWPVFNLADAAIVGGVLLALCLVG